MNTELITKYDMLPSGCKVLCAVSGGADSMCLLHWLYSQAERRNITVCAAHFEHGLRGEESLRDCRFVEDFCRERGIELAVEHGDVNSYAAENGMSTEEAARELGSHLGRGCKIVSGRKKGRIELEYYGLDDLNALLDLLNQLHTK